MLPSHSCRSASIGSSSDARRAGYHPKSTPTVTATNSDKKIDGIAALRDESDRSGYRVVIELRRDAMADVVLNQLYRYTPLQSSFGANVVALEGGRPQVMNLKDLLASFVAFRPSLRR